MRFFKRLWRNAPFATLVLVVSLAVAAAFVARSVTFWAYWKDPAHRSQTIEPWMTPKYIAHSWEVPPDVMKAALGDFERIKKGPMNLDQIAAAKGITTDTLISEIQAAIVAHHSARPTPNKQAPKDGA